MRWFGNAVRTAARTEGGEPKNGGRVRRTADPLRELQEALEAIRESSKELTPRTVPSPVD